VGSLELIPIIEAPQSLASHTKKIREIGEEALALAFNILAEMSSAPVDFEGSRFASISEIVSSVQRSSSGNSCGSGLEQCPRGLGTLPKGGY
jgi:hypothetical protein